MKTCSFEGCDRQHNSHGLCMSHIYQWKTWGELRPIYRSPKDRFWSLVDKTGECWEWTAEKSQNGYGRTTIYGRKRPAHRVSYEWEVGPIPQGFQVDHMCWNRACVRPSHLRAADASENQQNRAGLSFRNTSGYRGVTWSKKAGKWSAMGVLRREYKHLGYFNSAQAANATAVAWRLENYTHNILDRRTQAGLIEAQESP